MVYRVWDEVSVLLLLHDPFAGLCSFVWSVVVVTSTLPSTLPALLHFLHPFHTLGPAIFFGNVQPRRNMLRLLNSITRRGAFFDLRDIQAGLSGLFLEGIGSFICIG